MLVSPVVAIDISEERHRRRMMEHYQEMSYEEEQAIMGMLVCMTHIHVESGFLRCRFRLGYISVLAGWRCRALSDWVHA